MNIGEQFGQFIQQYPCAFMVYCVPENKMKYVNQVGSEVYGISVGEAMEAVKKAFGEGASVLETAIKQLSTNLETMDEVMLQSQDGRAHKASVKFGYFNPENQDIFIEITEKTEDKGQASCYHSQTCSNVQAMVHFEEENTSMKKYLHVLQELTDHILYRVDAKKRILYHTLDTPNWEKFGNEIHDYADAFVREKVVHPEDAEKYLAYLEGFYTDSPEYEACNLRFALVTEEYEWYTIHGKKIFDEDGNLVEVLGAMINVEEKEKIMAEFDQTKQYFDSLQSISNESFYCVDVESKTLLQKGQVAEELGLTEMVEDFPESLFYKLHPEDLEAYKQFTYDSMRGICGSTEVRVLTVKGEFQWYEIIAEVIRNKDGKIAELVGKMNNIQEKKTIESEYSSVNQYFTALQSMTGESFYTVDVKRKILRQKGVVAKSLGLSPEIYNFPESYEYKVHPDDLEKYREFVKKSMSGTPDYLQTRIKNLEGVYEWYEIFSEVIRNKRGEVTEFVGKMNNIHDSIQIQADYSILNQYFTAMQDLTSDKVFHIEIKTKTFHHKDKTAAFRDVPTEIPDFVETMVTQNFIHPDFINGFRADMQAFLSGEKLEFKVLFLVEDEKYEWFLVTGRFIHNEKGEPVEIFGKMQNIQKQLDLEQRASHDPLTKVLNKVSFADEVNEILLQHTKGVHHALVIIDMDDFKLVNDKYGHPFGDFVLENFAHRIKNCIREIDILGRLGGDEFIVFLKGVFDKDMALNRVETMIERLKMPFSDGEYSHKLGASIGVAIIPEDGMTYEQLYRHADEATYESKRRGKNVATLYSEDSFKDG